MVWRVSSVVQRLLLLRLITLTDKDAMDNVSMSQQVQGNVQVSANIYPCRDSGNAESGIKHKLRQAVI